ncbi:MAG: YciI family protein [Nannocystaceae bacterium]
MQYLLLIYSNEQSDAQVPEEKQRQVFGQWMAYSEELKATKAFVAGDALAPTATATSVRVRSGDRIVSDGPFAETKEQLGGYYMIDVENLDQAIEWAGKCPGALNGTIEIRPVMVFDQ